MWLKSVYSFFLILTYYLHLKSGHSSQLKICNMKAANNRETHPSQQNSPLKMAAAKLNRTEFYPPPTRNWFARGDSEFGAGSRGESTGKRNWRQYQLENTCGTACHGGRRTKDSGTTALRRPRDISLTSCAVSRTWSPCSCICMAHALSALTAGSLGSVKLSPISPRSSYG